MKLQATHYKDANLMILCIIGEATLKEGWQKADIFVSMRKKLREPGTQKYPIDRCRECEKYLFCHGGCQVFNINRCRKG